MPAPKPQRVVAVIPWVEEAIDQTNKLTNDALTLSRGAGQRFEEAALILRQQLQEVRPVLVLEEEAALRSPHRLNLISRRRAWGRWRTSIRPACGGQRPCPQGVVIERVRHPCWIEGFAQRIEEGAVSVEGEREIW